MPLTGAAARELRSLAHHLKPIVHAGKLGVTRELLRAVRRSIDRHELVKVRLLGEFPLERREAGEMLAAAANAELVQVIGRVLVLYRPHPKEPKIPVPKGYSPRASGDEPAGSEDLDAEQLDAGADDDEGDDSSPIRSA